MSTMEGESFSVTAQVDRETWLALRSRFGSSGFAVKLGKLIKSATYHGIHDDIAQVSKS